MMDVSTLGNRFSQQMVSTNMTSHLSTNTQWLLNFPEEMRIRLADVYIETMTDDIALLKESLLEQPSKIGSTLSIVHKIKGGTMQIGLDSISQSAVVTEHIGKLQSTEYPKALSTLVKDIEQSITDIADWKNNN